LQDHVHSLGYIFIHGIVEPAEVQATAQDRSRALLLSRERADVIQGILTQQGLIAKSETHVSAKALPKKFAISYGTGTDLYIRGGSAPSVWGSKETTGRVDIVLFYIDDMGKAR